MDNAKLLQAYRSQKCAATKRGIGFRLSFDEWIGWWISTGKLELRGKTKGCFQMCRRNDTGDYSLENIYCDTVENNSKLPIEGKPRSANATEKALATRRLNGKPWFPNGVNKSAMEEAKTKVFALIEWAISTKSPLYKGFKIFKCSGNAMRSYVPEWEKLNGPIPLPKKASGDHNGKVKNAWGVVSPDGIYKSAKVASIETGIPLSTVIYRCLNKSKGWSYIKE